MSGCASLDELDLGDDLALDARQHRVVVARLLVHDARVELVRQLLEVVPESSKHSLYSQFHTSEE